MGDCVLDPMWRPLLTTSIRVSAGCIRCFPCLFYNFVSRLQACLWVESKHSSASEGWLLETRQLDRCLNVQRFFIYLCNTFSKHRSRILGLRSYNTCTHSHLVLTCQTLIALQADARRCLVDRQTACAGAVTAFPDPWVSILERISTVQRLLYL
jgi:hypothetical protein